MGIENDPTYLDIIRKSDAIIEELGASSIDEALILIEKKNKRR